MGNGIAFKRGSIVWAALSDRSGKNPELRPLLVIDPLPLSPQAILCCLAISTDPREDPSDPAVAVPWDAETGSTTGLYRSCRVFLLWHVQLEQREVREHTGRIDNAKLKEILEKREHAIAFPVRP